MTAPKITAPRGTQLSCKGWLQEAAMRMIMNNLDPEVAEDPDNLIVYGGTGKAARNWDCFHAIIRELQNLENDQTLLVQSGKPVGVFRTTPDVPRVIIANSNLVGKWANWEYFRELEALGLIMYGQMTAGSWIYIGTQGILQGTYETFAALARKHWGADADLAGKLVVTAGLGGMGGAQTLAVTMNDGVVLAVEVDPAKIERRIKHRYLMKSTENLDEALAWCADAVAKKIPLSVGLLGNAAAIIPELARKGVHIDVVTDQTSAHDELNGYIPHQVSFAEALDLRKSDPEKYSKLSMESMVQHCRGIVQLQTQGAIAFDYGNNLRGQAKAAGYSDAFAYPGFVPAYIRPLFCEGQGPFRWVALSGDPNDIYVTDDALMEAFSHKKSLIRWLKMAREQVAWQGLPSRICWFGYGERAKAGLIFNELVRTGKVKAPIVIGRDHLDCGSVASPNRETEAMKDKSDAIADWPLLNFAVSTASGATWVSFHHGGGVGIGYSLHAGMVIVADGTDAAAARLERVLTNDPGMGVIRHCDAGYDEARSFAQQHNVRIPLG